MRLKSFKIKDFQDDKTTVVVDVPMLSVYRDMKILHDGIYAFFEVPELTSTNTERYTYKLISSNESIPENSKFICILDAIVELDLKENETTPRQAVHLVPIYELL